MDKPRLTSAQVMTKVSNGFMKWIVGGMKSPKLPANVDEAVRHIEDGIARFQTGHSKGFYQDVIFAVDPKTRADVIEHHPWCAVLMCSDSILSPEILLDTSSRHLYVIRTAGNVVDSRVMGSLEHALEIHPIKVLVIIGHEDCAAVKHACNAGPKEMTSSSGELIRYLLPAVNQARTRNPKLSEQKDDRGKRVLDPKVLQYAVEFSISNVKVDLMARSDKIRSMVHKKKLDVLCFVHDHTLKEVDSIPRKAGVEKQDEPAVASPAPKKTPVKKTPVKKSPAKKESPAPFMAPGLAALAAVAIASPKKSTALTAKPTPSPKKFAPPPPRKLPVPSPRKSVIPPSPRKVAALAKRPVSPKRAVASPISARAVAAANSAVDDIFAELPLKRSTTPSRVSVKRSATSEPEDATRPKRRIIANRDPFYEYL